MTPELSKETIYLGEILDSMFSWVRAKSSILEKMGSETIYSSMDVRCPYEAPPSLSCTMWRGYLPAIADSI